MKKIILAFFIMFNIAIGAFADDWTNQAAVERVNRIGKNIMEKNKLPTNVKFVVVEKDEQNAYADANKQVCVYTGMLNFVESDDELAAVMSHEIGHIVNNHVAKQTMVSTISHTAITAASYVIPAVGNAHYAQDLADLKMSRNEENEADITGIDLMINAGYKPQSMISLLYKLGGAKYDIISTHPSADKRTMYAYNYLTYNYPDKMSSSYSTASYNKFMEYAKPIINERNSNKKKLASFNKKQAKLQKQRIKKLKKYRSKNNTTGWDISYPIFSLVNLVNQ